MADRKDAYALRSTNKGALAPPNVNTRMPRPLVAALNRVAEREAMSRGALIKDLCLRGLKDYYRVEVLLENSKSPKAQRDLSLEQ